MGIPGRSAIPPTAAEPVAEVTVSRSFEVSADRLVRLCGDFRTLHVWHPAYARGELEGEGIGSVRTLELGGSVVRERLDDVSPGVGYAYSILEHPMGLPNGRGSLAVREGDEAGTATLEWSVRFDTSGSLIPTATLLGFLETLGELGLKSAETLLTSACRPPRRAPRGADAAPPERVETARRPERPPAAPAIVRAHAHAPIEVASRSRPPRAPERPPALGPPVGAAPPRIEPPPSTRAAAPPAVLPFISDRRPPVATRLDPEPTRPESPPAVPAAQARPGIITTLPTYAVFDDVTTVDTVSIRTLPREEAFDDVTIEDLTPVPKGND